MASNEPQDRREFLTCAVCTNIFNNPKLLPCHHTFCLQCVSDLASHSPSGVFPCPICRQRITVPQGGPSAFQSNFYILPQDLERARNWSVCLQHDKLLEFYCDDCKEAICINCSVTEHKKHVTSDISQAGQLAESELRKDKARLHSAGLMLTIRIFKSRMDMRSIQNNQSELEKELQKRCKSLTDFVKNCIEESLSTIKSHREEAEKTLKSDMNQMERNQTKLRTLQKRVEDTLKSGNSCEMLTVAREMRYGQGSASSVEKLTSHKVAEVKIPKIVTRHLDESLKDQIKRYFLVDI